MLFNDLGFLNIYIMRYRCFPFSRVYGHYLFIYYFSILSQPVIYDVHTDIELN